MIEDSLLRKTHLFLNAHREIGVRRLYKEFRDANKTLLRSYYYRWKRYVKPLLWLYEFMMNKWVPNKQITKSDKKYLKVIEDLLKDG